MEDLVGTLRWWHWPSIWWKQWRCRHEFEFEQNIYGDEINRASLKKVYRSWWVCFKCGKIEGRDYLVKL
jgi:hypothetical protein